MTRTGAGPDQAGHTITRPTPCAASPTSTVRRWAAELALVSVLLVCIAALGVSVAGAQEGDPGDPPAEGSEVTTTVVDDTPTSTDPEGEPEPDEPDEPEPEPTSTTEAPTTTLPDPVVTTRPPTPTTTVSNDPNPLIVAGPSDGRREIAPVDPTGGEPSVVEPAAPTPGADDAERVIRRVVFGLIAVAVLLSALAVYYWWITRPERPEPSDPNGSDDAADGDTVDPWLTDSTSTR